MSDAWLHPRTFLQSHSSQHSEVGRWTCNYSHRVIMMIYNSHQLTEAAVLYNSENNYSL